MNNDQPIRVMSVDDHPLVREGIAAIINSQPDMHVIATGSNGQEGILQYREIRPDVTLMDLRLPDISGVDAVSAIRAEFNDARIIMLTTFEGDIEIQRALVAGARAYLLKTMSAQQMLDTIREVHAGKRRVPVQIATQLAEHFSDEALTQRELEVLRHLTGGNRNRDIASSLFISEDTVKVHIKHIMGKLGATDRTHAMTIATRRGYIQI